MSFGRLRAIASDPSMPVGRRLVALGSAIQRYSWLTRTSYDSVRSHLTFRYGLRADVLRDEAIVGAFNELDAARRTFLDALGGYASLRRLEKRAGIRRPRERAMRLLYLTPRLGTPLPCSPAQRGV